MKLPTRIYALARRFVPHGPVLLFCLMLVGCASVQSTGHRQLGVVPAAQPRAIYVADFALDPRSIRVESGILPIPPILAVESEVIPLKLIGLPVNTTVRAHELIDLMADSLVGDLRMTGFNAYRLRPNEPLPSEGWFVGGLFLQIDEGNRLRRSVIGFGSGGTQLQLATSLNNLAAGALSPFCELSTSAHSQKTPGAIISFDPYIMAARFMLSGLDLDTSIMESAAMIARNIGQRIQYHNCAT
jgi:hypothetical protein